MPTSKDSATSHSNHNSESQEPFAASPSTLIYDADGTFSGEDVLSENGSWFASNGLVRLDLGGGRWIEIKEELTYLEERRMVSAGIISMRAGAQQAEENDQDIDEVGGTDIRLQVGAIELAKLKIWIADWNAVDEDARSIKFEAKAIDALKPAVARLMVEAIDRYQEELAARKNVLRLATRS